MPRLAYETPCRPVRKRADRTLAVIKLGTFAVAVGLVGVIYLLSGGGESREAGRPAAAVSMVPTTTPVVVAPPVESTVTSEVVPTPAPPPAPVEEPVPPPAPAPEPPRPAEPPPRDPRFAVEGEPCPRPGMYSMTERYQPVVCRRGNWQIVPMR